MAAWRQRGGSVAGAGVCGVGAFVDAAAAAAVVTGVGGPPERAQESKAAGAVHFVAAAVAGVRAADHLRGARVNLGTHKRRRWSRRAGWCGDASDTCGTDGRRWGTVGVACGEDQAARLATPPADGRLHWANAALVELPPPVASADAVRAAVFGKGDGR